MVNYNWFTANGFTYRGVTVTFVRETEAKEGAPENPFFKSGDIVVKIQGGSAPGTKEIGRGNWASALAGCGLGNVPDNIKTLFGIPKESLILGPAVLAPIDFRFADIDGDGKTDGVTLPFLAAGIAVELGLGDGGGGERTDFATGPDPTKMDLADLNGDQILDAVVLNTGDFGQSNSSVAVLLGTGDGGFQPATLHGVGRQARVFLGDLNGDQRPDVAIGRVGADGAEGSLEVLYGDGAGGFAEPVSYPVGAAPDSIVCADFNGDLAVDVAVANRESGTVSILTANGSGGLNAARHIPVGGLPQYLGAVHLDQDSRADLVVLHANTATLSVWRGEADGALGFIGRYMTGNGIGSFEILEYEDDPTAILAPDSTGLRFFYYPVDRETGELLGPPADLVGEGDRDVVLGDFNRDGITDIAVAAGGGRVQTLLGEGDGDFGAPADAPLPNSQELRGRGLVNVVVTVAGMVSNLSHIRIQ